VRGAILRWMYRSGRPNRVAAVLNRVSVIIGSAGLWPNRLATLEVRGRRTGRLISFPVVIADVRFKYRTFGLRDWQGYLAR
jgi:hypothetical protein